jgi:hypothetical protein
VRTRRAIEIRTRHFIKVLINTFRLDDPRGGRGIR